MDTVAHIGPRPLPFASFPIRSSLIVLPIADRWSETLKTSLNKPTYKWSYALMVEATLRTSFARVQCLVAPNNGTRYEEQNYTRIVFFVPVTADHSHSPALSGSATCPSSCRTLIIENRGIRKTHSKPLHIIAYVVSNFLPYKRKT
jgi:hypothetical protein